MGARKPPIIAPCSVCGAEFTLRLHQRAYWKRTGRAICSPECRRATYQAGARGGMTAEGRRALSQRMAERNPSKDPVVRAKIAASHRASGHRPKVLGGNGRGFTEPQMRLAGLLGWPMEVVVPTGQKGGGVPTHYKLDIACPDLMIAVEIDGGSHGTLRQQDRDRRKTAWLTGAGWTVLRFSNREVMADTAGCARTVMSTTSKSPGPTSTGSQTA